MNCNEWYNKDKKKEGNVYLRGQIVAHTYSPSHFRHRREGREYPELIMLNITSQRST